MNPTKPIPPDFTLNSGRSVTHYTKETNRGISLVVDTTDGMHRLTDEEWADYKAQILEWINDNGYLLKESTILL
ncbi:MAG: hypothetical protein EBR82_39390 [Caulobacteraceae bacterium]|nr:hypothetical protein [Caulobacteraceae bacterium]